MLYLGYSNRGGERNALAPQPTRPDGSVSARQRLSCFCSGGPLGRCFAHTLLRRCFFSTIPFRIRTYEKHVGKLCRIRTSETQHLNSFRIRTYRKTPGVGGPSVISSTPRSYSLARGDSKSFTKLSRRAETMDPVRNHWYIACHTEGLSKRKSAIPSCPGVLFPSSNSFRFPHQSQKESEQTCLRNSWQVRRLPYWPVRQPHPFARKK
jgi:hypothetical protein